MFDGFEEFDLTTSATTIHGRRGGTGPAVLLLHGIPETNLMWHRVTSQLAERCTIVATDLRGYGDSGKPPEPVPERLIGASPDVLVHHMLDAWSDDPAAFPPEVRAEYVAKFSSPDTIDAICEEYRAAATLDYEHDVDDRGTRKIACPTLALWSATGGVATWDDPLAVWRTWCDDVTGAALDCGHFLPEEAPDETARRLLDFLA